MSDIRAREKRKRANDSNPIISSISRNPFAQKQKIEKQRETQKKRNDLDYEEHVTRQVLLGFYIKANNQKINSQTYLIEIFSFVS